MCIWCKTEESLFPTVSKPHTYKVYIPRRCIYSVYCGMAIIVDIFQVKNYFTLFSFFDLQWGSFKFT